MSGTFKTWDYLIVTASNEEQARAYDLQLARRLDLGLIEAVGEARVVADPDGKRVGSGGSTLLCLMTVLNREIERQHVEPADSSAWERILAALRILIVHGGGDSRRLPAYGPCGKIFVPVPGSSAGPLGATLFDRQLPIFGALPASRGAPGQVVVTSGDALIRFDPAEARFDRRGMTALGSRAAPDIAAKHGVFCVGRDGQVRLYLQKPTPVEQAQAGALDGEGRTILDIGVMSFDAGTAAALLRAFAVQPDRAGRLAWATRMERTILAHGLDLYREISCALGSEATADHHRRAARASGSTWDDKALAAIYAALRDVPFHIQVVSQCRFLHFGTTQQLIASGIELTREDSQEIPKDRLIRLNTHVRGAGKLRGTSSWIEGCRVTAPVLLEGQNALIGVDVEQPLTLPPEACLDVLPGRDREGGKVWFVRCYGVRDTFKDGGAAATLCGLPIGQWLGAAGVLPSAIWSAKVPEKERSLWNARVFPAERTHGAYRRWLWMYRPAAATAEQKRIFLNADRYSAAEIAVLADPQDFYARRERIRRAALASSP